MKNNLKFMQKKFQAEECIAYFRENPIFENIFRGFREKYASYGDFSGTVILKNISESDLEVLEGFFQKNFHGKKSISISAAGFEKALKESRFEDFSPILKAVIGDVGVSITSYFSKASLNFFITNVRTC